ncbi:MAG TPA: DNA polymerase III subunit delta [Cyclobacteriaceae bacterium]|nr:DNA polymerase III subunit delta [Cyclobacteriaceae bacterium]
MNVEAKKILSDLKARKYNPVYFLQGEETYFIDLITDHIENNVLSDAEKGFNQVIVYGKDVTIASVLTHARRYPMMAERQVVIVKEAQDIPDLNKEMGAKLLLDYVTKPVPSTILVFCHKHKTLDKRRELGKRIDQYTTALTAKKLYDNQLPDFIHEYLHERRVGIEEKAVMALCEYIGNDLNRLVNEIDKLLVTHTEGDTVTLEVVMSQVGVSKEYNIFELQKAIVHRDVLLANKIVNYFESNTKRNPIIPVVAFLFSFFSKLLSASQLSDKNEKSIASALKVSPYAVRDYSLALRHFSPSKIMESVAMLKETDLKLKGVNSGSETDGQLFRELVYRIMH